MSVPILDDINLTAIDFDEFGLTQIFLYEAYNNIKTARWATTCTTAGCTGLLSRNYVQVRGGNFDADSVRPR